MISLKRRAAVFAAFGLATGGLLAGAGRPNILFIAVDDLRNELGCYGAGEIRSPNIDRLAASGIRFDRAYCQVAVCNPSRVSLMTGLRPDSSKVWTLDVRFRDTVPDVVTMPQHFRKHGYHAVSFGKIFHNPWPDNVSWSEPHRWPKASLWSDEARKRLEDFRKQMRADGKSEAAVDRMRAPAIEMVDIPDREHIDGAIARQALERMRELAKGTPPFFLAAGFVRPHLPFVVPGRYWDLYERADIPLAENSFLPEASPEFAMNTGYELRDYMDYADAPDPRRGSLSPERQRELKHGYYAAVSFIDAQVGLLLGELETLGLAENTIVVLWSDHGWKLGEHNSWCKQTNYELDTRVPLIIRDPRAAGNGGASRALVELLDLYPTLCELSGIPVAEHAEGTSLAPLLENPGGTVKQAAVSQFRRRSGDRDYMGYAMRTDRYRYIEWIDRRTLKEVGHELYDHASDPDENTNLAADPRHRDLLAKLHGQLWETLPEPPPYSRIPPKQSRPTIRFRNERAETLVVYWLPDGKERRKVGEVRPGGELEQRSTKGHRFLVEGAKSGTRKIFTVRKPAATITFRRGEAPGAAVPGNRPNVLFLMADDWSHPHASILGDPVAETPTFDRIAREGVLFPNAFVSSPSCTPSRHAIASGQFHWRLGDGGNLGGSLGADVPVYPDLLAETGYFTGYCRKGTAPSRHVHRGNDPFGPRFENFEAFRAARKGKEPFCFWYGAGEPHRPYDWRSSRRAGMDLSAVKIPPGLPDNETTRTDLGDYHMKVRRFDRDAARMIALLEENDELENTIVVMSGDNGMPFPRGKATLYDLGTRVPLAIRWGGKVPGGRTLKDFVSLTDLAPTFLEAAGLPVPDAMTGASLMPLLVAKGEDQPDDARDHVLTGMERHVLPHPSRAIRTVDFLYIRNFAPESWPDGRIEGPGATYDFTETPWPTGPGAFSHNVDPGPSKQWMRLHAAAGRDAVLRRLAFGRRPAEELYDLARDPGQLNNVVDDPAYREVRDALSQSLSKGLRASADPKFRLPGHATFPIHGWTVHLSDDLWLRSPGETRIMLRLLAGQLDRTAGVIPPKALRRLREVPIWINPPYEGARPTAEYHPDPKWLRNNQRDPAMAKAVEITNTSGFPRENRRMPYLLLHELAHAFHDRVLGVDHPAVIDAYRRAKESGSHEKVRRFNGHDFVTDRAYAMADHKEYFAEMTEACFGKNDFHPFTREDLQQHDPLAASLITKLWGAASSR